MHLGISMDVLTAVIGLSILFNFSTTVQAASSSKKTKPFSVWFQAEPNQPRKKDMKTVKLNRLIGADYNEMWMSKTPIIIAAENATDAYDHKSRTAGPDNLELPEQLPVQYQEMMRTWLVQRGSCPVEYVWTDLGKPFWPRWIKKGRCGRSEMMSCSWPPGMSCMPSSIRVLNLLRWHCWLKNRKSKRKHREKKTIELAVNRTAGHVAEKNGRSGNGQKKKKEKFRCLWIKVPYPVTEDCTCSCRKPKD